MYKSYFSENTDQFLADEQADAYRTSVEYRKFVKELINDRDVNFNPDEPFSEYVDLDGNPTFSPEEAKELQDKMDGFYKILGNKVYDIALPILKKRFGLDEKVIKPYKQRFQEGPGAGVTFTLDLDVDLKIDQAALRKGQLLFKPAQVGGKVEMASYYNRKEAESTEIGIFKAIPIDSNIEKKLKEEYNIDFSQVEKKYVRVKNLNYETEVMTGGGYIRSGFPQTLNLTDERYKTSNVELIIPYADSDGRKNTIYDFEVPCEFYLDITDESIKYLYDYLDDNDDEIPM